MRVCVIGNGAGALAAAHYAARDGAEVSVAPIQRETAPEERTFDQGGDVYPCFHEAVRSTDVALCGWLQELDALGNAAWREAPFAIYDRDEHQHRTLSTSLLTPRRLGLGRRLRGRYGLRRLLGRAPLSTESPLDPWARESVGVETSRRILRPLLHAACGQGVEELSAHTAQLLVRSVLCDPRETPKVLAASLVESLRKARSRLMASGVRFEPEGSVQSVLPSDHGQRVRVAFARGEEVFDAVIATGPLSDWVKLFHDEDEQPQRIGKASPTGAISVVALVRGAPPLPYREVLVYSESGEPLSWIHSPPVRERESRPLRPVYLTHRGGSHLRGFLAPDSVWRDRARGLLNEVSSGRIDGALEDVRVFRARSVDVPVIPGDPALAIPQRLDSCPVFLSTAARQPIRRYGCESAVMAAREAWEAVRAEGPATCG